jgi:hypothetical protein
MDIRTTHDHQKRDLQVSKKWWLTRTRGIKQIKDRSKRELTGEMATDADCV